MADRKINTEGGAVIEREVSTNSGDFVGRDSIQTKTNIFDGNIVVTVIAILVVGAMGIWAIAQNRIISVKSDVLADATATEASSALLQSYDVGEDFKQNCINTGHWSPYSYLSTPETISSEVPGYVPVLFKLGCLEMNAQEAWGFFGKNELLIIRKKQEQLSSIYGLSTALPESSNIELKFIVQKISTGEIYFGILSKSRANPLSIGETYVSAYPNNTIQLVTTAQGTLDSYPFAADRIYKLRFIIAPDKLQVDINDREKVFEKVGNFNSPYFMVGYRLETGETIDAYYFRPIDSAQIKVVI